MELELIRTYQPDGTNGTLLQSGAVICYTIELPWLQNQQRVSCIPEGRYQLVKRYSPKFKKHLMLIDVPNRAYILIHPANNAIKELQGCIAPVTILTGSGIGEQSSIAFKKLVSTVYEVLDQNKQAFITLKSNRDEYSTTSSISHTPIL